jgi:hypothetical protein
MGANEARFLHREQFQSFLGISEPIGTMINRNIFVHAGISLKWAKRPEANKNVRAGKIVTLNSLGYINDEAVKVLSKPYFERSSAILNAKHYGPIYYTKYEKEGDACHELLEALEILGVSSI